MYFISHIEIVAGCWIPCSWTQDLPILHCQYHSCWWGEARIRVMSSHHWAPIIDQSHKSHNAPVPYPTMHHFVTEMCTCLHISVTKWCNVGYWVIYLMHCGICEMGLFWPAKDKKPGSGLSEDANTHWGRVTHLYVSKLTIIGSDNGLWPGRRQAIIWTNCGILPIGPLGTNFSEILIAILTFSFKKMRLKVLSAKWCPFCLGLNVLTCNNVARRDLESAQCYLSKWQPFHSSGLYHE